MTEETTDLVIDKIIDFLSGTLKKVRIWKFSIPFQGSILSKVREVLDEKLPGELIEALKDIMLQRGLLTESEMRQLHPSNPGF